MKLRQTKTIPSFFAGAAAATGAPAAAPPAGAPTGAEVIAERSSSIFCPLRALANKLGQKGSTSFPLALRILAIFSP